MKIDPSIIHLVAIIVLGIIAVTLVITHQTTLLGAIIHVLIGATGMAFVPALLRKKTEPEKVGDSIRKVVNEAIKRG